MADPIPARHDDGATSTVWWTLRVVFGLVPIGIAIDLVAGGYYDIAVRDVVMAIASFCLARLTATVPAAVAARQRQLSQAPAR